MQSKNQIIEMNKMHLKCWIISTTSFKCVLFFPFCRWRERTSRFHSNFGNLYLKIIEWIALILIIFPNHCRFLVMLFTNFKENKTHFDNIKKMAFLPKIFLVFSVFISLWWFPMAALVWMVRMVDDIFIQAFTNTPASHGKTASESYRIWVDDSTHQHTQKCLKIVFRSLSCTFFNWNQILYCPFTI